MNNIPIDVRWKIQEDIEDGAQMLANHFLKPVTIDYDDMYRSELPKEAIENYVHGGSGPFERISYSKGLPQIKKVSPNIQNNDKQNIIHIRLVVRPNKHHYIHKAEMHKKIKHDYCKCCIAHASTAITIGSGDKSSKKTKGRFKRERAQLFYASNGATDCL